MLALAICGERNIDRPDQHEGGKTVGQCRHAFRDSPRKGRGVTPRCQASFGNGCRTKEEGEEEIGLTTQGPDRLHSVCHGPKWAT